METLKQKLKTIKDRIVLVFSHEPWWVEFWSGFTALFWSYVSSLSGNEIYYHPIFLELSMVASAIFWQVIAFVLAVAQITCLIINNYKLRWLMCFFASWFWALLAVAIMNSEPQPPSLALYAAFACINLVSMVKLARSHE